mmetsp:Transcript_7869/g.20324  ORF Transcript_7869/g.20324 Transcript_7869/m.20324 type:complete len:258 (-) Transcript_7869:152-925(-)
MVAGEKHLRRFVKHANVTRRVTRREDDLHVVAAIWQRPRPITRELHLHLLETINESRVQLLKETHRIAALRRSDVQLSLVQNSLRAKVRSPLFVISYVVDVSQHNVRHAAERFLDPLREPTVKPRTVYHEVSTLVTHDEVRRRAEGCGGMEAHVQDVRSGRIHARGERLGGGGYGARRRRIRVDGEGGACRKCHHRTLVRLRPNLRLRDHGRLPVDAPERLRRQPTTGVAIDARVVDIYVATLVLWTTCAPTFTCCH